MFNRIEFILDTLGAISIVLLCVLIVTIVICREFSDSACPTASSSCVSLWCLPFCSH